MTHAVAVFTRETVDQIIVQGGTGHWVTNPKRAAEYPYIVCVRNRNRPSSPEDVAHGAAFLIGRIADAEAIGETEHGQSRAFIRISEYALINIPHAWGKTRNPVWYTQTEELGIDLAPLTFEKVQKPRSDAPPAGGLPKQRQRSDSPSVVSCAPEDSGSGSSLTAESALPPDVQGDDPQGIRPLTIQEAKAGVAAMFGVTPDHVRIIVEG